MADVLRRLGLNVTGWSYSYVRRYLRQFGISTTQFAGHGRANAMRSQGRFRVLRADEVLRLWPSNRRSPSARMLRRALLEIGRKEICNRCGISGVWNGLPYQLQIHHRNGKRWDCRRRNLEFICHNCHSQTENFGHRGRET